MFFSAVMALFSSAMVGKMLLAHPEAQQDLPAIFRFFPLLAVAQIAVAAVGFVSGINFLRLKAWSRISLEILTWLLLAFVVGFGIYWEYSWLSMTSQAGSRGAGLVGAIMGPLVMGMYGVALVIMLKYLRGDRVKEALRVSAEPASGPEGR
jgi:hypothetical protein